MFLTSPKCRTGNLTCRSSFVCENVCLSYPESWGVEILAENIYPGLGAENFSGNSYLGFLRHSSGWELGYKNSSFFVPKVLLSDTLHLKTFLCHYWTFPNPMCRNLTGSMAGERSFRQEDVSLSDTKLMDPFAVPCTQNKTFQAENCIVYIFALFPKYFWLNSLLPSYTRKFCTLYLRWTVFSLRMELFFKLSS